MPEFSEIEKKSLDWHIRCLKTLRSDIIRENKGLRIERAIDFSDLFVYMYPERMSQIWVPTSLIQVMFNKTNNRFILLPPAVWELLMYIKRKGEHYQRMMEDIDYKSFINNPYVKRFMEVVPKGKPKEIEKAYREMEENYSVVEFLMKGGIRGWIGAPLSKLSRLIQGGTLMSVDRLVNLKKSGSNKDIFKRVLEILNIRRDTYSYKEPNRVDAHNFAIVYNLNETYGERHYFTITTSSSIPSYAYEEVKWRGGILNRSPIDVLYYAETKYNNIPIGKIDECIRENETLIDIKGRNTVIGETTSGYDRFLSFLKETSNVPQRDIEKSLPIETAYTLKDEDRFWNRVEDVKIQFQHEIKRVEYSLEELLKGYDLWVDSYESYLKAKEILEKRRRSIRI